MGKIESFTGENFFLSNFYPSEIRWSGWVWPTLEHAYQAEKTDIPEEKQQILDCVTPGKAKRYGATVTLSPNWDKRRYNVMLSLVRDKFGLNRQLKERLLATGDTELVEGNNWHDNTWGACTCPACEDKQKENWLGRILMQVREELKVHE